MRYTFKPVGYDWHKWFAWRPVMFDRDKVVWLETIERRYYDTWSGLYPEYLLPADYEGKI